MSRRNIGRRIQQNRLKAATTQEEHAEVLARYGDLHKENEFVPPKRDESGEVVRDESGAPVREVKPDGIVKRVAKKIRKALA